MTSATNIDIVPQPVQQASIEHRLGDFHQYFAPHKRVGQFIGALVLLLFAAAFLAVGLVAFNGAAAADQGLFTGVVAVAGAVVLVMIIVTVRIARKSPVFSASARAGGFHVFEHGFVEVTPAGPQVYRWDGVQTSLQELKQVILNGIPTTVQNYRLAFHDGRKLRLNVMSTNMAVFGPLIQRELTNVQLPKVTAHVRSGQPAEFGAFTVTNIGVAVGGKDPLPWPEVCEVTVRNGFVFVLRAGQKKYAAVAAKDIPNLWTFVCLTQQLAAADGRL